MHLRNLGAGWWCVYSVIVPILAIRTCESCIPLGDLLSEAYGIEISVDKL